MKRVIAVALAGLVLTLAGCAPEVGGEAWCKQMNDKPKGDWSANEAADYAKHCVFR
ncbi:MAG: DUF3012 domain-containing protein [gamma proteobacterium symbiont of Phacoides pectinatus]